MRKTVLPIVAALLLLAACGTDGEPAGSTTTPAASTVPPSVDEAVMLNVEVGTVEVVGARVATISIAGDTGTVTGYLSDPAPVIAALAGDAIGVLVNTPDPQQACTEQYGGPDVAHFTGTVGDTPVDVTVDRSDGCGIADWDLLQPLLPAPLWADDPGAIATYGDVSHPVQRQVGDRFAIRLAANATTGFEWQIELPDFLTLVGDTYEAPDDAAGVGAGGTQVYEVELTAAGEGTIELVYRQPFDETTAPAETRSITVVASG